MDSEFSRIDQSNDHCSISMSRQYLNASTAVEAVISGKKSFKSYCNSVKIGKLEYALAAETLRYRNLLDDLFTHAGINVRELDMRYGLLLVMTYELLFGRKKIDSGGAVKRKVKELEPKLKDSLQVFSSQNANEGNNSYQVKYADLLTNQDKPRVTVRYARVNTIRLTVADAIAQLREQDPSYTSIEIDPHIPTLLVLRCERSIEASSSSYGRPPSIALAELELVKNGSLIIQDKSSCMPSQVLSDVIIAEMKEEMSHSTKSNSKLTQSFDCIDVCAAPGNKTSHLACCLHDVSSEERQTNTVTTTRMNQSVDTKKPSLYAFEKNPERFQLLSRRMNEAGATHIVIPTHADFLITDPSDKKYANVTYALVDPSCSGSGLLSLERLADNKNKSYAANKSSVVESPVDEDEVDPESIVRGSDVICNSNTSKNEKTTILGSDKKCPLTVKDRLMNLQSFQISIIQHAMKFPRLRYLVYSTCSIHNEENEDVVASVLTSQRNESGSGCSDGGWDVIAPERFISWTRRGMAHSGLTQQQSNCLIRCDPADQTSGFFVALFKKSDPQPDIEIEIEAKKNATQGILIKEPTMVSSGLSEKAVGQTKSTSEIGKVDVSMSKRRISLEDALLSMPVSKKHKLWRPSHKGSF